MARAVYEQQGGSSLQSLPKGQQLVIKAAAGAMNEYDRRQIRLRTRLKQNTVQLVAADIDPHRLDLAGHPAMCGHGQGHSQSHHQQGLHEGTKSHW